MTTLWLLAGPALMALGAYCSNRWPGVRLRDRATARMAWWGLPMAGAALCGGASAEQAAVIGAAGWVGAWVPHSEVPDCRLAPRVLLRDLVLLLARNLVMLAPPAAALWACGMFWFEMVKAGSLVLGCIGVASIVPSRVPGLRQGPQLAGVLFGAAVGLGVAAAAMIPAAQPELIGG